MNVPGFSVLGTLKLERAPQCEHTATGRLIFVMSSTSAAKIATIPDITTNRVILMSTLLKKRQMNYIILYNYCPTFLLAQKITCIIWIKRSIIRRRTTESLVFEDRKVSKFITRNNAVFLSKFGNIITRNSRPVILLDNTYAYAKTIHNRVLE